MQYSNKAKITTIIGIGLIVFVASMVGLPFMNSDSAMKKASHENIKKLEGSEKKLLNVITQEKTELESKIGGRINFP